jgi:hypothetical protein
MRKRNSRLAAEIAKGLAAGAGASFVMNRVTTFLYRRQAPAARRREERVRGGKTAYQLAAEKMAGLAGRRLEPSSAKKVGTALHWAMVLGAGATYSALRTRAPWVRLGGGLLFGALLFVLVDEGANTAFGFTPHPREFPWQSHARGLLGHLAYGAAADAQLRLFDRLHR